MKKAKVSPEAKLALYISAINCLHAADDSDDMDVIKATDAVIELAAALGHEVEWAAFEAAIRTCVLADKIRDTFDNM